MGNLLAQAIALGDLAGIEELRDVVRASEPVETYMPHHTEAWANAYARLLKQSEG